MISAFCAPVHCLPQKVTLLVFYTWQAWSATDMTEEDLLAKLDTAYASTNEAMTNSKIDLKIEVLTMQQVSAGVGQARPHRTQWWCFFVLEAM